MATATEEALVTLINHPDDLCLTAFHFYVDDSKTSSGQVGAAVPLLCEYADGFTYGGHICHRVQEAQHAHLGIGEHSAMIWSLIWAVHCSTWVRAQWNRISVGFHFYFDATGTDYLDWPTFLKFAMDCLLSDGSTSKHTMLTSGTSLWTS